MALISQGLHTEDQEDALTVVYTGLVIASPEFNAQLPQLTSQQSHQRFANFFVGQLQAGPSTEVSALQP